VPITSQTLAQGDIERILGLPPGNDFGYSDQQLTNTMNESQARAQEIGAALRSWALRQGLPPKHVQSALPTSLIKAYNHKQYLRSWRNRVNPNWSLLDGSDDDSDVVAAGTMSANVSTTPPSAAPPDNVQTEAWLKALYAQIDATVNRLVADKLASTTLKLDEGAKAQIRTLASETAKALIDELAPPRRIEVADTATGAVVAMGLQHERFPTLLRAIQARDHRGFRLNIWLTGPTGSGKTSAAEASAKALSLPFGSDGSLDADYKVLGFRDANGNIISTQFLDIYEHGGIYVADEIDNWLPNALLSLNAALANGFTASPRGLIRRHPDACVIACANTWGLGATGDYVGRTRLDAASLDRFHPKITWPYDERMERAVASAQGGASGEEWHDTVRTARKRAQTQGLKVIISPRATFNGISLLNAGFEWDEVIAMTLTPGLSPEQIKAIGLDAQRRPTAPTVSAYSDYNKIEDDEPAWRRAGF
jgi:hypothetical protein